MATAQESGSMTRYQFQIDDETWGEWKETVPRSKSLETRIIELVEADRDGRVLDPGQAPPSEIAETLDRALRDLPDDVQGRAAVEDARRQLADIQQ